MARERGDDPLGGDALGVQIDTAAAAHGLQRFVEGRDRLALAAEFAERRQSQGVHRAWPIGGGPDVDLDESGSEPDGRFDRRDARSRRLGAWRSTSGRGKPPRAPRAWSDAEEPEKVSRNRGLALPADPASRRRAGAFARTAPPSGCEKDVPVRVVEPARDAKEKGIRDADAFGVSGSDGGKRGLPVRCAQRAEASPLCADPQKSTRSAICMTRAPVPLEVFAMADSRPNVVGVRMLLPGVVKLAWFKAL